MYLVSSLTCNHIASWRIPYACIGYIFLKWGHNEAMFLHFLGNIYNTWIYHSKSPAQNIMYLYIYIYIYIYCVHVYLHNIDWRHSYNIYIYIYCTYTHIHTHVPVSCINTAHLCPPTRLTQWPPCMRPPVDPWLTSSRNGRQLFRSGCTDCGGPTNSWVRYPLVNWQFANWKITIFKNGKSTINGSFSICNKLPGIRN